MHWACGRRSARATGCGPHPQRLQRLRCGWLLSAQVSVVGVGSLVVGERPVPPTCDPPSHSCSLSHACDCIMQQHGPPAPCRLDPLPTLNPTCLLPLRFLPNNNSSNDHGDRKPMPAHPPAGQQQPPPRLVALRLFPGLVTALLLSHPSGPLRQAAYEAGQLPRAQATLQV